MPTEGDDVTGDQDALEEIRRQLDVVDRDLADVLARRSALIMDVVRYKRERGMAVVDRDREDRMLDRIGAVAAEAGLDPRIARQVLRSIIDAFTLLEVEELGPGHP